MRVLWLVSGLLLQIPEKGNMIMDCGDGTWGQMCRFFGLEGEGNVWDVLRDLKVSMSAMRMQTIMQDWRRFSLCANRSARSIFLASCGIQLTQWQTA